MRSLIVAACVAVPVLAAQGRPSPAPPPLGAWTPVPELPGMGRPVYTASSAARRRALLARIGRGVVLVPAAHERELERDYVQDNDFRQSNTFFYFTELETQDAWLLLVAGGGASETVLFLPPRTPLQERGAGRHEHHGLGNAAARDERTEEHTSELQSLTNLVCRLLLAKQKNTD